jgi:hypothetical protein
MLNGAYQRFSVAQASGASVSTYLDLGVRYNEEMAVRYVTMSTGAEVTVYASDSVTPASAAGDTFYAVKVQEIGTAAAAYNNLVIGTATSGGWAQFKAPAHRFIKFGTSAVVSGGVAYTVVVNG